MPRLIRHFGLKVTDMEAAIKLYTPLGFTLNTDGPETCWGTQAPIRVAKLDADDGSGMLELLKVGELWPQQHMALTVNDADKQAERFGHVFRIRGKEGIRVQYVIDPWGNCIELVEEGKP